MDGRAQLVRFADRTARPRLDLPLGAELPRRRRPADAAAPSRPGPGRSRPIWRIPARPGSSSRSRAMRPARCSPRPLSWVAATGSRTCCRPSCLQLRDHAGAALAEPPRRVIVGRPVRFAGASPDPALALTRYETAFRRLGFSEILYAFEPVAAAFFFARRLSEDATVLVADFGGGTSDFSIVRFERQGGEASPPRALGQSGRGGGRRRLRLPDHRPPGLAGAGQGHQLPRLRQRPADARRATTPAFARWDQLALMRASRDMRDIRGLVRKALEPEKLARLVELLDGEHGYRLYQSVSRLKEALSGRRGRAFDFRAGEHRHREAGAAGASSRAGSRRELAAIETAADEAMAAADLSAGRGRPGVPHRRLVVRAGGAATVRASASAPTRSARGRASWNRSPPACR